MARFLAWLDEVADSGKVDEVSAAMRLEDFRRETGQLKDISFDTISASGPHGAVVHYRPTNEAKRVLDKGSLYLIDSGGQYVDGTTDITRTIAVGKPTPEMKRHYGIVLKAHIAIASARFPKGHARPGSRSFRAAARCGRRGSTSITAPATASAAICRSMRGPSACRGSARRNSSPA